MNDGLELIINGEKWTTILKYGDLNTGSYWGADTQQKILYVYNTDEIDIYKRKAWEQYDKH